jgi:hypothetical protein
MKKFNLILRMVDDRTPRDDFAKMKENVVNREQQDLNNNDGLGGGNLGESVVPKNVVPENVPQDNGILSPNDPQAPVQNVNEEMPAKNEFDKMTEGVMGDVDLREESNNSLGKRFRDDDVPDIDNLEPDSKKSKINDEVEIINPKTPQNDDVEMRGSANENIKEIIWSEQRNKMIAEILGDPEFEKLIDQTMEKAENDQLYVNMDKLTKDLIEELKNDKGNEKEAFKKIIKEFFEGASDKVDRKELMDLDTKKLIELDTQDILKQLGSSGSSSEAEKVINMHRETVEKIFEKEEIEIRDLTKSMRDALGYREIYLNPSLNPEKEPIIQAIPNIHGHVFGKGEKAEFDDIARRRANMLLKLYDSMESERIRKEKIQKHRDEMDRLFGNDKDYSKMNKVELQNVIEFLQKERELVKKIIKERKEKGAISNETEKELELMYNESSNKEEKIRCLREEDIETVENFLVSRSNIIESLQKRLAALEKKEKQNKVINDERNNFLKDRGQKIISAIDEVEKDPKVAALEKIDIARSDGGEILKELIEEAYQAFDAENHPERKKMIDEFAKTGDISEQSEQSASLSVGKATKVVHNVENLYKNGTPENNAFDIGKRDFLDAAQYNKHLIGVSEKIEKSQKIEDIKLTGVKVEGPQQPIQQTERNGSGQGMNF